MGVSSKKREYSIRRFQLLLGFYIIGIIWISYAIMSNQLINANLVAVDKIVEEHSSEPVVPIVAEAEGEPPLIELVDIEPVETFESESNMLIVEIYRKDFNIGDLTIGKGTTVIWLSKDDRIHKIACYKGPNRFFTDENLYNEDSTEYTFNKAGKYLCLDAIFGVRQNIDVV